MLNDREIVQVADEILKAEFAQAGYERAYLLASVGQDGEPMISVVARFRPGAPAAGGKAALRAISRLRQALRSGGEERESVLRYEFPDDDIPDIDQVEFAHRQ